MRRVAPRARAALFVLAGGLACLSPAGGEQKTLKIQGDLNDTAFGKGKEHSVWTGNAVLDYEDTTIYADRVDLWGKSYRYAECEGSLRVVNRAKDIYLTCDRVRYDQDTKFLVALGNVYMEDRKNGLVVKGDSLQYDDERDETIVQIRVRIFGDEEDLQCRAEFARYLRDEELLVLSGMPYVLWKGDEYRAVQITITLKDGKVQSVRMVEGSGKITSTEEEKKPETAGQGVEPAKPATLAPEAGPSGAPPPVGPGAGGLEP